MSCRLIFHPLANDEYVKGYQWYEQEQKGLGERFEKMLEQRLQQIMQHPENYSLIKPPYREAPIEIFPYTLVYTVDNSEKLVYISAIYHTKRNPKKKYRK